LSGDGVNAEFPDITLSDDGTKPQSTGDLGGWVGAVT
jgi:hypothetical protein